MITTINEFKLNEAAKFTFKTEKPVGKWKAFDSENHYIKLNGKQVGSIAIKAPFKLTFMVLKTDADKNPDKNPNCSWKHITLKKEFESLQEAKDFANANIDRIMKAYTLHSLN